MARRCDSGGRPVSQPRCGLILWITEETRARASECRLREPIGASDLGAQRCAEPEKNLLFSASRTARAKQHASPQRSGAQFEQGYACLRSVRAVGCSIRACSDSCSTKGCRIVRLSILSVVITFSQYFIILTCVRCVNTLFVPQERPGRRWHVAERFFSLENHPHREHSVVYEDERIGCAELHISLRAEGLFRCCSA